MGYLDRFDLGDLEGLAEDGIKGDKRIPYLKEQSHFEPVFGFDYISLNQGKFCFDNPKIPASDFIELLAKCKEISSLSYDNLTNAADRFEHRFHPVDRRKLEACGLSARSKITINGVEKDIPEIYQFGLYTDKKAGSAPRVIGFIGKWGIFYLLWFDWEHLIYPEK